MTVLKISPCGKYCVDNPGFIDHLFSLPEPLNLDDLLHDDSPGVEDEDVPLLEVRHSSQPTTDDEPQFRQSDLNPALNQLESQELRQLGLEQQARLLEKDRELAKAGQKVVRLKFSPFFWMICCPDSFLITPCRCARASRRWKGCVQNLQVLLTATGWIIFWVLRFESFSILQLAGR